MGSKYLVEKIGCGVKDDRCLKTSNGLVTQAIHDNHEWVRVEQEITGDIHINVNSLVTGRVTVTHDRHHADPATRIKDKKLFRK